MLLIVMNHDTGMHVDKHFFIVLVTLS